MPPHPRWTRPPESPTGVDFGANDSGLVDGVSDDKVDICRRYSTRWDSFAPGAALFDVSGDGRPEPVDCNGFRAGLVIDRVLLTTSPPRLPGAVGSPVTPIATV